MNILSIAGSDPSSGAGIQGDIKTFSSLGAFGLTVITSITSQNTTKFGKVEPVSSKMVKNQIEAIFSDFKVDAIKIGMVYNSSIIRAIYSKLNKVDLPIILDPVIKSTTGGNLIEKNALWDFKKQLVPLAYVITPNVSEAENLSEICINTKGDLLKSASKIRKMGAKNVVITGYQLERGKISDFVLEDLKNYTLSNKKLLYENHGSGCNFSSSLTVAIAKGKNLHEAVEFAKTFTFNSRKNSQKIGNGMPITRIIANSDKNEKILGNAIMDFKDLKKIYSIIPECQTNFVYSKANPKSIKDILGVSGRIVKAGQGVIVAGGLEYGGSMHVATAVLEMSKKFPRIRSGLNVKYDQRMIRQCKKKGFLVVSYNRDQEPNQLKKKENSSVAWGIKSSIKNARRPPDFVFHKGDFGKEPMILVFGKNPNEVVEKISRIL